MHCSAWSESFPINGGSQWSLLVPTQKFQNQEVRMAKENCNWMVLGAALSLICPLMWFHQQVSRTHFHPLQPIKSINSGGFHAWTCHGKRWLCWTTTSIPGGTEQTQCIADNCLGSPKTQVVVLALIQAEKHRHNQQHAFLGAAVFWFPRTPRCLLSGWRISVAKWDWQISSLGKFEVQICFKSGKSLQTELWMTRTQ